MLTAEELDRLDRLARKATPGPWRAFCTYAHPEIRTQTGECVAVLAAQQYGIGASQDARLIAACDPQTILALVEMARRAQAAETELDGLRECSADHIAELTAERDELRKRAEAAEFQAARSAGLTDGALVAAQVAARRADRAEAAIAAAKKEQGNG